MNKSTTSLSFPDVNVWMALVFEKHTHRQVAKAWWHVTDSPVAFMRFTQLALLRLLTTRAAMNGNALTLDGAWQVYNRLFQDDRVVFVPEPPGVEALFRKLASSREASPKVWADAWLLAFARAADGTVVTLDQELRCRGAHCLLAPA